MIYVPWRLFLQRYTDNDHSTCTTLCQKCSREKCLECTSGYYGDNCQSSCVNCQPKTACNKINGICDTCTDGYSGPQCNYLCHSNCESCHRYLLTFCLICPSGNFDDFCNLNCSHKCLNHSCDIATGVTSVVTRRCITVLTARSSDVLATV